jgi:hypothetical protein
MMPQVAPRRMKAELTQLQRVFMGTWSIVHRQPVGALLAWSRTRFIAVPFVAPVVALQVRPQSNSDPSARVTGFSESAGAGHGGPALTKAAPIEQVFEKQIQPTPTVHRRQKSDALGRRLTRWRCSPPLRSITTAISSHNRLIPAGRHTAVTANGLLQIRNRHAGEYIEEPPTLHAPVVGLPNGPPAMCRHDHPIYGSRQSKHAGGLERGCGAP